MNITSMIIDEKIQILNSNTTQFANLDAITCKQMKSSKGIDDRSNTIQAIAKHLKMDQTCPTFTL